MKSEQHNQGNILVVDDNHDNLRLLATLLTQHGYRVRPAPSSAHALTTTRKELPDLILLDILMPEMDGYEVCRALKGDNLTRDIPVIFLSALDTLEDKIKGFEVGGVDYITKPFHEKDVVQRVETHLKIRQLQQDLRTETLRFRTLAEATFESIIIHEDHTIVDVNPAAVQLLHCSESHLIGADLKAFIPANEIPPLMMKQAVSTEGSIIRSDKTPIPVEIRTKRLPLGNRQLGVTAIRDLTKQKKIEQEKERLLQENTALRVTAKDRYKFGEIIGRSPAMQEVYELISKASASAYPVVVAGESGTGKELTAKTIHNLRFAENEPFITVNCGAVTESLFEREFFGHRKGAFTDAVRDEPGFLDAADGGTLFLDEIAELPLAMQVKLLRVLESGEYTPVGDVVTKKSDVRFIAASNKDLTELVLQEKFRQDLFYRIQVIQITLPPLRERREDIRLLVENILSRNNAEEKVADLPEKLREMLFHYDWPGNVRELMNTVQRYLATDVVTLINYPNSDFQKSPSVDNGLHDAIETLELRMIKETLQKTQWHRGKTAEILKIPRRTLQRKIGKYGLRAPS